MINLGSITLGQIISYIENNFKRQDPITGIVAVLLKDYQKYIIKQMLTQNTIIMQARQMGITHLYT